MSDFDPARKLVMAKFKTVLGYSLPAGTPLTIAAEPEGRAQIDEAMARRLHAGGIAVYAEDFRPTPVESKEAEAARLLDGGTASPDLTEGEIDPPQIEVQDDLRVSNSKLRQIAADENVAVESDDNKTDLQRKIMEARAARAPASDEAPHTEIIGG